MTTILQLCNEMEKLPKKQKRLKKIILINIWKYEKDCHIPFPHFFFKFVILLLKIWCRAPDSTLRKRIVFTVLLCIQSHTAPRCPDAMVGAIIHQYQSEIRVPSFSLNLSMCCYGRKMGKSQRKEQEHCLNLWQREVPVYAYTLVPMQQSD